jgi:hypothetical protein
MYRSFLRPLRSINNLTKNNEQVLKQNIQSMNYAWVYFYQNIVRELKNTPEKIKELSECNEIWKTLIIR